MTDQEIQEILDEENRELRRDEDKQAQHQRAQHGWAIRDTWSFDTYLAWVISEGIRYLADHATGFPVDWEEEGSEDVLFERYKYRLQRIAQAFEDYRRWRISNDTNGEMLNEIKQRMADLIEYFPNLWD